jgi:hypothetical protein
VPVRKFRSLEEMNAAPAEGSPGATFDRFLRHCARYRILAGRVFPRGVAKFRTIEDAQAARARLASERRPSA